MGDKTGIDSPPEMDLHVAEEIADLERELAEHDRTCPGNVKDCETCESGRDFERFKATGRCNWLD